MYIKISSFFQVKAVKFVAPPTPTTELQRLRAAADAAKRRAAGNYPHPLIDH